jgi:hypothetical protein
MSPFLLNKPFIKREINISNDNIVNFELKWPTTISDKKEKDILKEVFEEKEVTLMDSNNVILAKAKTDDEGKAEFEIPNKNYSNLIIFVNIFGDKYQTPKFNVKANIIKNIEFTLELSIVYGQLKKYDTFGNGIKINNEEVVLFPGQISSVAKPNPVVKAKTDDEGFFGFILHKRQLNNLKYLLKYRYNDASGSIKEIESDEFDLNIKEIKRIDLNINKPDIKKKVKIIFVEPNNSGTINEYEIAKKTAEITHLKGSVGLEIGKEINNNLVNLYENNTIAINIDNSKEYEYLIISDDDAEECKINPHNFNYDLTGNETVNLTEPFNEIEDNILLITTDKFSKMYNFLVIRKKHIIKKVKLFCIDSPKNDNEYEFIEESDEISYMSFNSTSVKDYELGVNNYFELGPDVDIKLKDKFEYGILTNDSKKLGINDEYDFDKGFDGTEKIKLNCAFNSTQLNKLSNDMFDKEYSFIFLKKKEILKKVRFVVLELDINKKFKILEKNDNIIITKGTKLKYDCKKINYIDLDQDVNIELDTENYEYVIISDDDEAKCKFSDESFNNFDCEKKDLNISGLNFSEVISKVIKLEEDDSNLKYYNFVVLMPKRKHLKFIVVEPNNKKFDVINNVKDLKLTQNTTTKEYEIDNKNAFLVNYGEIKVELPTKKNYEYLVLNSSDINDEILDSLKYSDKFKDKKNLEIIETFSDLSNNTEFELNSLELDKKYNLIIIKEKVEEKEDEKEEEKDKKQLMENLSLIVEPTSKPEKDVEQEKGDFNVGKLSYRFALLKSSFENQQLPLSFQTKATNDYSKNYNLLYQYDLKKIIKNNNELDYVDFTDDERKKVEITLLGEFKKEDRGDLINKPGDDFIFYLNDNKLQTTNSHITVPSNEDRKGNIPKLTKIGKICQFYFDFKTKIEMPKNAVGFVLTLNSMAVVSDKNPTFRYKEDNEFNPKNEANGLYIVINPENYDNIINEVKQDFGMETKLKPTEVRKVKIVVIKPDENNKGKYEVVDKIDDVKYISKGKTNQESYDVSKDPHNNYFEIGNNVSIKIEEDYEYLIISSGIYEKLSNPALFDKFTGKEKRLTFSEKFTEATGLTELKKDMFPYEYSFIIFRKKEKEDKKEVKILLFEKIAEIDEYKIIEKDEEIIIKDSKTKKETKYDITSIFYLNETEEFLQIKGEYNYNIISEEDKKDCVFNGVEFDECNNIKKFEDNMSIEFQNETKDLNLDYDILYNFNIIILEKIKKDEEDTEDKDDKEEVNINEIVDSLFDKFR